MSDAARKDFTSKATESMTPDSTKSTTEQIKETVTDGADKVARGMPDSTKSTEQTTADKVGRSKDEATHSTSGESIMDQVKGAIGMDKSTEDKAADKADKIAE